MPRLLMLACALVAAVFVLVVPASAQPTDVAATRTTVYRLEADSSYRNACFDPCMCFYDLRSALQGTMQLTLVSISPNGERRYRVDDVNLKITVGGAEQLIRGSGTYFWYPSLGMLTVLAHRLQLDLSVNAGPVQRFDSETIAGASDGVFPPIRIVVDKNNQVCTDEVLTFHATPVPEPDILRYCLNRDSQAVRGCFPPCMCPIWLEGPVVGSMALVKLPPLGPNTSVVPGLTEYAVIRVRWNVLSPAAATAESVTGSGFYSVRQPSLIEGLERTTLALTRLNQPERVWRGVRTLFVFQPQPPPALCWDLSLNGFFCYDEAFYIRAARCPRISPSGIALDPADEPDSFLPAVEPSLEPAGPESIDR